MSMKTARLATRSPTAPTLEKRLLAVGKLCSASPHSGTDASLIPGGGWGSLGKAGGQIKTSSADPTILSAEPVLW